MKNLYSLLLSFFLIGAACQLHGAVSISNVSITTSPILACNPINISVAGIHDCGNYVYSNTTYTIVGTTIYVDVNYTVGAICLPVIMPFTQTASLTNVPAGTYTLVATGTLNGVGGQSAFVSNVVVQGCCDANAAFTLSPTTTCVGLPVSTTNASTMAQTTSWYYNNSLVSSAANTTFIPTSSGVKTVKLVVTGTGCADSISHTFTAFSNPNITLGPDTSICAGSSYQIGVSGNFSQFSWSTGGNTSMINVNQVGIYSLTVTNINGCQAKDTMEIVSILPLPIFTIGNDVTVCPGQTLTLNPGLWDTYNWSNGSTAQSVSVGAGTYFVTVQNAGACAGKDTIVISNFAAPAIQFVTDTAGCDIVSLTESSNFATYAWSTGATTNSIDVLSTGVYALTVTDANGCSDTLNIDMQVFESPIFTLGADTSICVHDSLLLSPTVTGVTYLWQDGSSLASFNAVSADSTQVTTETYSLVLVDANGCEATDTIAVTFDVCASIEELHATSTFSMYPNPVLGSAVLLAPEFDNKRTSIVVMNANGQVVYSTQVNFMSGMEITLKNLPAGIYGVMLSTAGNQQAFRRIVKE